ncbi:hypothetical protein M8J77_025810 [Diaphorina citri]|nr:hypothetical protein M8J77_025810 [Diaphorina citri]
MYVDLISSIQPLTEEMPNIAEELSSPVIALTAGAPCSPTLFNKIRDTFGIKHLISAFGMTEISPVAFLSTLNDTEDQMLNYIGRPMPYQEIVSLLPPPLAVEHSVFSCILRASAKQTAGRSNLSESVEVVLETAVS